MENRAQRRRAARARQASPPAGPVRVRADYHSTPTGIWSTELEAEVDEGIMSVSISGCASPLAVFEEAMAAVRELSDLIDQDVFTIHTLDGDPAAWAELARREGFG